MSKKVIIVGGEGNGGVAVSCIQDMRRRYGLMEYEVYGWLHDFEEKGKIITGFPVLGKLADIKPFLEKDFYFIYAIHSIAHAPLRIKLFNSLNIPDEKLVTLVHPLSFIGEGVELGPGTMVMANCYIGPAVKLGKCVFVMANSIIGHNTTVGSFSHLSAGSVTSSYIKIGEGVDIALNATVLEKLTIGNYSVVGAGAMATKDIPERTVVVGNPARVLKTVEDS